MKTIFALRLLAAAAAFTFGAGTAYAQNNASIPADARVSGGGMQGPDSVVRINGDTSNRDALAARDAAMTAAGKSESRKVGRTGPAAPEDITVGSELRDNKGELIGTIDSVTMATAVVDYSSGKVAIPLEAVGKNNKGLLVAMSKADFLKMVATAQ